MNSLKYEKSTHLNMQKAEEKVTATLKEHGFGVLSRIDVSAKLAEKLGVQKEPYVLLGACNPELANRALDLYPDIGYMLPCNVVLRQINGVTHVGAVLPTVMLSVMGDGLSDIAREAEEKIKKAIDAV